MIYFTVPGPPKGKGRARSTVINGHVRAYTPASTRSEEGAIRLFASQAMGNSPPIEGPIYLRITAYMPIPQSWSQKKQQAARDGRILPTVKPDADNLMKMIDACNKIIWRDDAQIVEAVVQKYYSTQPRLEITVKPI